MRKRNGVLRFWGALALCLCLCAGALAESAQGYTVAEKLLKQLEAGSGFSGTLEVQTDGTDAPLSFQWDYIHTRKNSETVEQQRLDLRLMDGETVRTTARFQWENPALRFQTDLWSAQWYELNLSRTEQAEGFGSCLFEMLFGFGRRHFFFYRGSFGVVGLLRFVIVST